MAQLKDSSAVDPHISGYNPATQQTGGARRLVSIIGLWGAAGLFSGVVVVIGLLGQAVMPYPYRPGDVIGSFFGSIHGGELDAARPALVTTTQQTADVQNISQAKLQEQVLAMQTAQQYGLMTATPSIIGSWFAQVACMYGLANNDAKYQQGCSVAQQLNNGINQKAGAVMDQLGPTRAWTGAPQGGTIPAATDAKPLKQGEFYKIARLEDLLSVEAVSRAKFGLDLNTNRGLRMYLGKLAVMAGEDDQGAPINPGTVYTPEHPRRDLPAAVRSP